MVVLGGGSVSYGRGTPVVIVGLLLPQNDATVKCWGMNDKGQLNRRHKLSAPRLETREARIYSQHVGISAIPAFGVRDSPHPSLLNRSVGCRTTRPSSAGV